MVWSDRVIGQLQERFAAKIAEGKPLIIRDEKTLSGRVHVGSLRGIVLHGLVAQLLSEKKIANRFLFEFNDNDPMDGLPVYLDQDKYKPFMGRPLFTVPAHEPGADNYPLVFGKELESVIRKLGLPIDVYTLRPLYEQGKFNDVIRLALDHAKEIRAIYKEVSGSMKGDDWYPLQVICEKCGKVGTTKVIGWDPSAKQVAYRCEKAMVKWAEGCGHEGQIDPFDGRGKLPWKVEWAAKWKVVGVDIEGAGKDHSAAGGSRQIAARISEEIFKYPNPFDIPYEFFNIGGKKMSSSKGLGASAKEVSDLLPPVLLKLLMIRKMPNQPIDFDPEGTTIPTLFDEYDRLGDVYFDRKPGDPDFARTFHQTQIGFPAKPADLWQMRFSLVSFLVQMPHLDLKKEAQAVKGSALQIEEISALEERAFYTKQWLDQYAPESAKYVIAKDIPADLSLSPEQKAALAKAAETLKSVEWKGEKIHTALHAVKAETGIEPKAFFEPFYRLLLGRQSGPQLGWFLSTFPQREILTKLSKII
jgi:lysyl-tRNA synthetase class 1